MIPKSYRTQRAIAATKKVRHRNNPSFDINHALKHGFLNPNVTPNLRFLRKREVYRAHEHP
jgi:hypothetical protein